MPLRGLINKRPSGYKKKNLKFVTWHVRTQFDTNILLSQLQQYGLDVTVKLEDYYWRVILY